MDAITTLQLGKKGITQEFIESLKSRFKNYRNIKVSVLKNSCRDKKELKIINEKILGELGKNYKSRIIGYTIAIKKFRKEVR